MRGLRLALGLVLVLPCVAAAQPPDFTWTEIAAPYTRGNNAYFGSDYVWDGERLVVRSEGRLDVYTFDGTSAPVHEQQIVPNAPVAMGYPGAIALDHGRLLASANGDPPNWSLYQFQLVGTTWSEAAHLVNPMPAPGDGVFVRLQLDGNRWAASEPYINSNRGSVDLVHYSGTGPFTWTTANRTMLLGPNFDELTGHTILLRGDELLVSTIEATVGGWPRAGRVTLYRDTGTGLMQLVTIDNPTPAYRDQFGDAIALDATSIYVGCHLDDTSTTDGGAIYVYDRSGAPRQTILGTVANGALGGGTLEVDGDYLLASATTTSEVPGSGHLHLYRRDASGTWVERADVVDFTATPRSYFGASARLRGHTILVASQSASVGGASNAGRLWWGTFSEPDGRACTTHADCTHRNCIAGTCQPAGTMADAGVDAGSDAGALPADAGVDAASDVDAGADAATLDVGPDAGMRDASGDGSAADATTPVDAGATPRIPLSCTCRAAGERTPGASALTLVTLALAHLVLRRRARSR